MPSCLLFATGVLDAKETCSGFSSGTVVVTGVLAVVMAGLRYTGVLQWMLKHVFGLPDRYPTALLRMMVPVSMLSAFISNTMLTMLFGNVLKRWSRKLSIAPSKLYLPMVYAVQMGGVCTLIGTSTNIIVADPFADGCQNVRHQKRLSRRRSTIRWSCRYPLTTPISARRWVRLDYFMLKAVT